MLKIKPILFISFLVTQSSVNAQDTVVTYYDKNWYTCTQSGALYYGLRYTDSNGIHHSDDYYIGGKIQMTGTYLKKNYKKKHGLFTWYYENGAVNYTGNYSKGHRVGEWTWWYDSGQLRRKNVYNDKGLLHGPYSSWFENGQPDAEGSYADDEMNGVWKFYHPNGQECSRETYVKGELVALEMWNEAGEPEKVTHLSTDIEPEYPGGETAMIEFIRQNVVYPEQARELEIRGIVYVQFVVGYTGAVEDISILESVHPLLDEEALRVIKLMPAWHPGKQHNRAVRVRYTLPINFNIK